MNSVYDEMFICSTDTVVGLGGPVQDDILEQIYRLKQRKTDKKVIILIGNIEQVRKFKQWNKQADDIAKQKWPGATTIIVNNQGFRIPNNNQLINFLIKNGPMYVSSANISGYKPINIKDAQKVFPMIKNVYDFGVGSGKPSTIINLDTKQIIERN
ncbi:L-threonylcarbamoyladenylate synthase [Mycoplasma sp. 4013]